MVAEGEYGRGWAEALELAASVLRSQAKQARVLAGRSRFPKNGEREADVFERAAERIEGLSPDDA